MNALTALQFVFLSPAIKEPESMSLRALRTLLAVVQHGTFAKAGDAVGLTQSAISLQIKSLEQEFGVALFDRSRRRPVLTEAGRILLARVEDIMDTYDRIPEALSGEQALVGRLRLGAIQSALSGPLPDALVAMRQAHPGLRVQVSAGMSAELAQLVATGELDAAITTAPVRPHPPELIARTLYEDRFWVLAPADQAGRGLAELLRDLPFIQFDARAWAGRMIARELRQQGIAVQASMTLDSQEVIVRMVVHGLGIAIAPLAERALTDLPPLIRLPFGDPQLCRTIVLLQRRDRPAHRFAQAMADAVIAISIK
jgi:DNA-binding transcriptional LysR family regulator